MVSILKHQQFSKTGIVFMLFCASHTFLLLWVYLGPLPAVLHMSFYPREIPGSVQRNLLCANTHVQSWRQQWSFRKALQKAVSQPVTASPETQQAGRQRKEKAF